MRQPGLDDLRHRFDEFAARVGERARDRARAGGASTGALSDDYWENVQDLFTRDVSQRELRDLFAHDAQDTFRFFTREVDLAGVWPRPWYQRYPLAVWRIFLATAFRLSPARRIVFALAVPLLAIGWTRFLLASLAGGQWEVPSVFTYVLVAATLLFGLLMVELRDKLGLKGDLEIARQIQFGLLPFEPFERRGTTIHAAMRPANTVGGDYFDIIELGAERVAIVIGDVAGKGIPAALLMALLQGSLRTLLSAGLRGEDLMRTLNAHLHANIPSNRLITLFYAEYDPAEGRARYVNAGHNAPFVLRPGGVEHLAATGMALGVVPEASFESAECVLAPGERLFLYTDGVTEAFDPQDREYGEERLQSWLVGHAGLGPAQLIEGVRDDVLAFSGSVRPRDDMTMMVVAR
ncbi:MAG TPA: PP2C family protein-serine/threonine phosphatase [Vicinamibacteria bacterium]|nr:PP2C family protein-serine/threonine phosphatase [Vicinamibacteria bacterium]